VNTRVIIWTATLAFIGYMLTSKAAIESDSRMLIGTIGGAIVGFILGNLFVRLSKKSK
jgi:uncharacterized membrane protein YjjB (DUF3815 family)